MNMINGNLSKYIGFPVFELESKRASKHVLLILWIIFRVEFAKALPFYSKMNYKHEYVQTILVMQLNI